MQRVPILAVAFGAEGKLVMTGDRNGIARLWEADTGRPIVRTHSHPEHVSGVAFSPDGKTILTAGGGAALGRCHRAADRPTAPAPE